MHKDCYRLRRESSESIELHSASMTCPFPAGGFLFRPCEPNPLKPCGVLAPNPAALPCAPYPCSCALAMFLRTKGIRIKGTTHQSRKRTLITCMKTHWVVEAIHHCSTLHEGHLNFICTSILCAPLSLLLVQTSKASKNNCVHNHLCNAGRHIFTHNS